jgi:hypothetical protein
MHRLQQHYILYLIFNANFFLFFSFLFSVHPTPSLKAGADNWADMGAWWPGFIVKAIFNGPPNNFSFRFLVNFSAPVFRFFSFLQILTSSVVFLWVFAVSSAQAVSFIFFFF